MTSQTVRSVCPYCGVGCGIVMTVADNRVIKVQGDKAHPTNAGRLCTKGLTCGQALTDSGRLQQAMQRPGREQALAPVDMDRAIVETGTRLRQLLDQHGPDALSFYVSGQMSLEAQYLANKLAKGYVRTRHIESNSRLCMASASSGYKLSLGADGPPGSYEDFDQADLFFVIGANMADCHPILFLRLLDRVKAGARLIVVDPRRTATADKADLFLQIRPGSDLALLNGLLHLLVQNDAVDQAFIARFTEGWDRLPAFLEDYTPARVAALTGLEEAAIRQAADMIAAAPQWMSCWTMGLNQSTHGTWNTNALCNLHLATGTLCRPGSGPFSLTGQPNAMGGREMGYMGPGLPGQRSLLVDADRQFVERLWNLPPATLRSDVGQGTVAMFDDMRSGAIKACWVICTNPVASVANRQQVIEALQAAELVICQDAYADTETNRYADVLLPGALWAEAEGVMINSERNLTLMQKAVEAPGAALPDWQIIARVACEMGFAEGFGYTCAEEVFEEIKRAWNPATGYDLRGASYAGLRDTPRQWPCAPDQPGHRSPIRYLSQHSDGPHFPTPSGKAQFFARPHMAPADLPDDDFPLVLNTGRLQHQWHTLTKTGKIATLNKLDPGPFVEIHPLDAERLGIGERDQVQIASRRGQAVLPARISDRVLPGNCFAPFHWNDLYGEGLAINAVTSDAVDPVSQQPEFKYAAVALSRVGSPRIDALHVQANTPARGPEARPEHSVPGDALASVLALDNAQPPTLSAHEQHYMQGFLQALRQQGTAAGVPVLPASAPLAASTRLWVDGLLAGLYSRSAAPAAMPSPEQDAPRTLVVWASQTGNAQALAERCAEQLGQGAQLRSMDQITVDELSTAGSVVWVTSTFGDGDAPDNASGLWAALQGAQAQACAHLRYAVLALGDSSYEQFCGFGRKLDERLHSLGGQRLLERLDCEPDYQEPAGAWLLALAAALGEEPARAASADVTAVEVYSKQRPWLARVIDNRVLNAPGAQKETRQVVFDITDSGLQYQAGDALGVWPSNCMTLVEELLACLGLDSAQRVDLKDHPDLPLAVALHKHLDITRITPAWLELAARRSSDSHLAMLVQPENKAQLKEWLWGRQLIDLLEAFPLSLSVDELLALLKPLQPRLYSISSSPLVSPDAIHVTMSTVRYRGHDRVHSGVCSGFLADRSEHGLVPIFVQKSAHFRVPPDPRVPMIMVGPGTGVAPFRAFLQERQASGASGGNWLVFGEQRAACDFYYREELHRWLDSGHLQHLDTAFSRDQASKIYVQQRLLEQGARVWEWLQQGAHFYVCGDASRMAKDVDAALRQVLQAHAGMSEAQATAYVARLASDKRYVRDVY